jgi:hypothetical protein
MELNEKIDKFRKRGITVSIITFLVFPVLLYLLNKEIDSGNKEFGNENFLIFCSLFWMLLSTLLWISLFNKLK